MCNVYPSTEKSIHSKLKNLHEEFWVKRLSMGGTEFQNPLISLKISSIISQRWTKVLLVLNNMLSKLWQIFYFCVNQPCSFKLMSLVYCNDVISLNVNTTFREPLCYITPLVSVHRDEYLSLAYIYLVSFDLLLLQYISWCWAEFEKQTFRCLTESMTHSS